MITDTESPEKRGRDPPTNEHGEFVCARQCPDETRCRRTVPVAYFACYQHDRSDPIAWNTASEDRTRSSRTEQ